MFGKTQATRKRRAPTFRWLWHTSSRQASDARLIELCQVCQEGFQAWRSFCEDERGQLNFSNEVAALRASWTAALEQLRDIQPDSWPAARSKWELAIAFRHWGNGGLSAEEDLMDMAERELCIVLERMPGVSRRLRADSQGMPQSWLNRLMGRPIL